MDVTSIIIGLFVIAVGVACIIGRGFVADFTADAARQRESSTSLLNQQRTERDLVRPYTSPDGRRLTRGYAAAFGSLLVAGGLYLISRGM